MAIQPSNRADGSSHVLRFRGNLAIDTSAPFANGTINEAYAQNQKLTCRFLMGDATATTDKRKKLPASAYDDGTPAAATRPEAFNVTTWAENAKVRMKEVLPAAVAAPIITYIGDMDVTWEKDTTTTGLQTNTGLPVLLIDIQSAAADANAFGTPEIILEVTITDSLIR